MSLALDKIGKIEGRIGVTRRRGKRRKKLLGDFMGGKQGTGSTKR